LIFDTSENDRFSDEGKELAEVGLAESRQLMDAVAGIRWKSTQPTSGEAQLTRRLVVGATSLPA